MSVSLHGASGASLIRGRALVAWHRTSLVWAVAVHVSPAQSGRVWDTPHHVNFTGVLAEMSVDYVMVPHGAVHTGEHQLAAATTAGTTTMPGEAQLQARRNSWLQTHTQLTHQLSDNKAVNTAGRSWTCQHITGTG